jgi:hypothetical protein
MKKFLLSLMIMAVIGTASKVNAQCEGVAVTFSEIDVSQTATHIIYQFKWLHVKGNASIQARLRCGGTTYVLDGPCIRTVKDSTSTIPYFFKDSFPKALIPATPECNIGVKEVVLGVWTNPNCGGLFCPGTGAALIPLPVVFKSFDATRSRSNVAVKWETSTEIDNAGFNVQRNIGGAWQTVAYVPSQAPGGNSQATLTYSFNDLNTTKGISQYRIQQVDFDGKNKFSEIRAVRGEGQLGKTTIFPNPSNNGNASIVFEDANVKRDVSVVDMTGKVIKQWRNVTNNNLQIENLPSGIFSIRILAVETGEQIVEKIVVNKR